MQAFKREWVNRVMAGGWKTGRQSAILFVEAAARFNVALINEYGQVQPNEQWKYELLVRTGRSKGK